MGSPAVPGGSRAGSAQGGQRGFATWALPRGVAVRGLLSRDLLCVTCHLLSPFHKAQSPSCDTRAVAGHCQVAAPSSCAHPTLLFPQAPSHPWSCEFCSEALDFPELSLSTLQCVGLAQDVPSQSHAGILDFFVSDFAVSVIVCLQP